MEGRAIVRRRTTVLFGSAIACGIVGVLALNIPRDEITVDVVIANTSVARGGMLTREMVRIESWPQRTAVSGLAESHEQVVDRCVLHPIEAGEPILEHKLAPTEAGRGLHSMIPQGMRAFTIKTTDTAGVAGFVLPGSQVDVLLNMADRSASSAQHGGGITITLLQNVEVLAVAQQLEAPSENRVDLDELKSVTLLVTPKQAARLNVAISKGTLHLSLRNPQDAAELEPPQATLAELVSHRQSGAGFTPAPVAAPRRLASATPSPRATQTQIWTLRGTERGRIRVTPASRVVPETEGRAAWPWMNLFALGDREPSSDE